MSFSKMFNWQVLKENKLTLCSLNQSELSWRLLTADVLNSSSCQHGRGGWTLDVLPDVWAAVTTAAECKHKWSFVWTQKGERWLSKPGLMFYLFDCESL